MLVLDAVDLRCSVCDKLLFRGLIGMGFIEVKCVRCGNISTLHAFDHMLIGKPNAYIIVYNSMGKILLTSESASDILGYRKNDFTKLKIMDISPKNQLYEINSNLPSTERMAKWESYHKNLTTDIVHKTKTGSILKLKANFYAMTSIDDQYTIGVYDNDI